MTNQEHLSILKQGVETWHQWRLEHPEIRPDLSGADLSSAHFNGAYLFGANLNGTNLSGAHLFGANLREANLREAHLREANLNIADLSSADLSSADLFGAHLNGAHLNGAYLFGADLSGACLFRAHLNGAHLNGTNLSGATLSGTDLSRTNLSGTDLLSGADLREANLSGTNLFGADLSGADLSRADLSGTNLNRAHLNRAHLSGTDLSGTIFIKANLSEAILIGTDLSRANLSGANLSGANLSGANLSGANLSRAILIYTNLTNATLTACSIHGISVWNVQLEGTKQESLVITQQNEPSITVDNIEVAQFIYLLLNHQKIRQTIDTVTSHVVLLLGTFPSDRKAVVDALSTKLREHNYSPVIVNFEGTENKDIIATVRTLANMAHFVLLDLTDLQESIREIAEAIVPHCVVPIRPLLLQGSRRQEYERFRELGRKHRWVLAPYRYKDLSDLQTRFQEKIMQPINEKIIELKQKKPLKMFIGYAPEDKNTLETLKIHLRPLERAGLIEVWDDQDVAPGEERAKEIERHLSDARIILLLISPDFLSSDDCDAVQMSMAVERCKQGEARVIPIILRPCAWQATPLKELQPLPKDGIPLSKHNQDDVFFEVSEDIGEVIKIEG